MKKCCVLIPYYNAGDSLLNSINSIDFSADEPEVLVVDDGSPTISASEILNRYEGPLRIHLVTLERNRGIEFALNAGLEWCSDKYEYIARLDCGDLCKGERISKQIFFLDENPQVMMVGAWVDYVNMKGERLFTHKPPVSYESIRKQMFINSTFVHPAVMLRSSFMNAVGKYPTEYPAAEDYALFFEIAERFPVRNIPEVLLDYEVDPSSISSTKRKRQIRSRIAVILKHFDFSLYAFYGLARSILLLYTSRRFIIFINRFRF